MQFLPYEDVEAFYNLLVENQNEDGYVVSTANHIGVVLGMTTMTARELPFKLEKMGVLKTYSTKRGTEGFSFTLMKIIAPLTRELYMEYVYNVSIAARAKAQRTRYGSKDE